MYQNDLCITGSSPRTPHTDYVGWPWFCDPPASTSPRIIDLHHRAQFYAVLGIKPRDPWALGKHSTNWVMLWSSSCRFTEVPGERSLLGDDRHQWEIISIQGNLSGPGILSGTLVTNCEGHKMEDGPAPMGGSDLSWDTWSLRSCHKAVWKHEGGLSWGHLEEPGRILLKTPAKLMLVLQPPCGSITPAPSWRAVHHSPALPTKDLMVPS